jgi:hypothetical protein
VSDPRIIEPTDAIISVSRACICGSDLSLYKSMERTGTRRVMGREAIGVVEHVGVDVRKIKGVSALCFFIVLLSFRLLRAIISIPYRNAVVKPYESVRGDRSALHKQEICATTM